MKICMLAPEFLPVWGGVGTYIVELVRHLPNDIEIHVVTPMREGFGKEKVSTSDYDFSRYFGSNVHVHFVCKASETFFYNAKFQYACLKYVPKLVKEGNIDIIHSHTAHMPDLLLQFKSLNVPTVTTIHTTIEGQRHGTKSSGIKLKNLEFSEKFTYLTYFFLCLAESIYFSKERYYVTVSKWMKEQVLKRYPKINSNSISVIYNSVDPKEFYPKIENYDFKNKMILFTGRLTAAKGIGYIVEAIPRVLKEHPDAHFIFIGAGNSVPFKRRLSKMGISKNKFKFLGYVKEKRELIEYYRNSSVYLAPTLYENLPIRVLEALACGVPAVASNICAIPEIIKNGVNGILIKPGSVEELVEAVIFLLSNPNLSKKIGKNGRKTVLKKFNWDINVTKIVDYYQKILELSEI